MSKNTRNRILLTALAALLLVTLAVGGTMAWLVDTTGTVTNTFKPSQVDVDLKETTGNNYQFIPGKDIKKDPTVTVTNDVDAYVFVKVEKAGTWPTANVSWNVADGWTPLEEGSNVYWRKVLVADKTKTFEVIKNSTITVKDELTNAEMADMYGESATPATLTITAYACQTEGFNDAAAAWVEAQKATIFGMNTIN